MGGYCSSDVCTSDIDKVIIFTFPSDTLIVFFGNHVSKQANPGLFYLLNENGIAIHSFTL